MSPVSTQEYRLSSSVVAVQQIRDLPISQADRDTILNNAAQIHGFNKVERDFYRVKEEPASEP